MRSARYTDLSFSRAFPLLRALVQSQTGICVICVICAFSLLRSCHDVAKGID